MSDCGGLLVAFLAAPLLLAVLLVAGIGTLALQGARLLGNLALSGIEFVGTTLAAGVRSATHALTTAGTIATASATHGAQWASSLFDSAQVGERLRAAARSSYQAAYGNLSTAVTPASPGVPAPAPAQVIRSTVLSTTRAAASMPSPCSLALPRASGGTVPASATAISGAAAPEVVGRDQTIRTLAQAQAVSAALESELPLRLVAERWHGEQLSTARAALASAGTSLRAGQLEQAAMLATQAETLLTTAAHQADQHLAKAERATIAATVGNTLEDMGYQVKVANVQENVALVGRRGHQTMAMVVRPGGALEMDMAGFEGNSCNLETKALLEGLRRNGLVISAANLARHGRFEGGALIRAAQRRGTSLEVALAELMAPPAVAEPAGVQEDAPVRRRARLAPQDETGRLRQARAWLWQQDHLRTGGRS